MSEQNLRIGVVGARGIGRKHMRDFAHLSAATLSAVAEPNAQRRAEVVEEFGIGHGFSDAGAMFSSGVVDAVILAVPNALHASMSIAAMEAGLDVLVEKPIAMTLAEADAMIRTRDQTGRTLMVGMNQRYHARSASIRSAMQTGRIGRFQFGRTWWTCRRVHAGLWGRGDWCFQPETSGGGPLLDLGIHRLDLALWFLGFPEVVSVSGMTSSGIGQREGRRRGKDYAIEDGAVGLVRFADGSALEVAASYFMNTPHDGQGTCLMGTEGWLDTTSEQSLSIMTGDQLQHTTLEPVVDWPDSCLAHFVEVLQARRALCSTAEQGRLALQIVQAIYTSARFGRSVTLDGNSMSALGDESWN